MNLPFFPFYAKDFHAKTAHLSLEEDGAYNRLLRLCWMSASNDCTIPDDDDWIMKHMRTDKATFDQVIAPVLDEFFIREKGRCSNARLSEVFSESNAAHKKRVEAGKRGGKNKALKSNKNQSSNATAMSKQPEPEPEPEGISKDIPEKQHDNSDEGLSNIPACLDRRDDDQKKGFAMEELHAAVAAWNDLAKELGLSEVEKFTSARQSKLRARLKDCGGLDGWMAALDKIRETPGLRGGGDTAWKASFDFLLQESRFVKLMEGGYNGWGESQKSQSGESKLMEAVFRLGKGEK